MPSFKQLQVWQRARELVIAVYRLVRESAIARDFTLKDQLTRSAISIASNIVEGAERDHCAEFVNFLRIAKASNGELRAQVMLAVDVGLCAPEAAKPIDALADSVGAMIAGLIRCNRR